MAESLDRGAHQELIFLKAGNGFMLRSFDHEAPFVSKAVYAFGTVEGVAAWLLAEYGAASECEEGPGCG